MPHLREALPGWAIDWEQEDQIITEKFGAVIVATGYQTFDHAVYGEYGGGRYPDVITGLQLERLMSASGPTGGEVIRPSDGAHPKTVVFVSCVGSRDEPRGGAIAASSAACIWQNMLSCSRSMTLKCSAISSISISGPGVRTLMSLPSVPSEEYGALYLRGRVSKIYQDGKKLMVCGEDSLIGRPVEIPADLVVLATGQSPALERRSWPKPSRSATIPIISSSRRTPSCARWRPRLMAYSLLDLVSARAIFQSLLPRAVLLPPR